MNSDVPRRTSPVQRIPLMITLCVAAVMLNVNTTVINLLLPAISRDFVGSAASEQWYVLSYTLLFGAALLPCGLLGDRFGRHRGLLLGLAIFAGASLFGLTTTSSTGFITSRLIQGLGAALVSALSLSLIPTVVDDEHEIRRLVRIWTAGSVLGMPAGPLLGGLLVEYASWRGILVVNVALCLLAAGMSILAVPAVAQTKPVVLDRGVVLSVVWPSVAIAALVLALTAHGADRSPAWIVILLGVTLAAGAAFLTHLRIGRTPFPPGLARSPGFAGAASGLVVIMFAVSGAVLFVVPQFLQIVFGEGPATAAVHMIVIVAGVLIGVLVTSRGGVTGRLGSDVFVGLFCAALGFVFLSIGGTYRSILIVSCALVVIGAGVGALHTNATSTIISAFNAMTSGIGSAAVNIFRQLGATLGVALIGTVTAVGYRSSFTQETPASAFGGLSVWQDLAVGGSGLMRARIVDAYATAAHIAFVTTCVVLLVGASIVGYLDRGRGSTRRSRRPAPR